MYIRIYVYAYMYIHIYIRGGRHGRGGPRSIAQQQKHAQRVFTLSIVKTRSTCFYIKKAQRVFT
jgi:hypothetical protein